ncbi:hypothetical protein LZ554_000135 [Drepanopeziza brunnea f. sp. 'monogermtubi']|nr:hypothetical protein LZ554_000135 [Drepanopeziza brunnea f. sp. 'monogermtubi']
MMLSSQSTTVCSILLALGFLLNSAYGEDGKEWIGYRTVSSGEANWINHNLRLYPYFDKSDDSDSVYNYDIPQIGKGYYMINKPETFLLKDDDDDDDQWYCVAEALSTRLQAASKVWIPEYTYDKKGKKSKLWGQDEKVLLEYIKTKVEGDPENAIRFSYMEKHPNELQMVLPTSMVVDDRLNTWSFCYPELELLENYMGATIDWTSWEIAGDPKPKEPSWIKKMLWKGSSSGGT